jgi:hypothetical protein
MTSFYALEPRTTHQCKLVYRGYDMEITRVPSGWRVGIHPRTSDLPILRRCEVIAGDQNEAVLVARGWVDQASLL